MTAVRQLSFAGGELSPSLYARVDIVKYATGLKTCRNFIVQRHGGVSNRPGLQFIGEVKDSTKNVRLIPFIFNSDQTYMLEFGDQYIRFMRNGAQLSDLTLNITNITQANPAVVTYTGTDPVNGQEVAIRSVQGMIEVNSRNYKIANVNSGANTFELQDLGGTNIDSTGFTAYTSGGFADRIYEISSPYAYTDLAELQFAQSADVVTLVHPSYAPRNLSRSGHTNWTLSTITFTPTMTRPTNVAGTPGAAGANVFRYKVTAISEDTFEESLVGLAAAKAITGATNANPISITCVGHGYTTGDEVYITGMAGMTELNNEYWFITNTGANTFQITGVDGTAFGVYTSGGNAQRNGATVVGANPTSAAPHVITWSMVTGALEYNIYKESNGIFGYMGTAGSTSFSDVNITPDTTETPPIERNPFDSVGNYPSVVSFFQQRKVYANTDNEPEKIFMSRSGKFNNFTIRSPSQDDDAITFTMAGRQVNEVRHVIDLGQMIPFTASGEWAVGGNDAGILTPSSINPKQHSYNGANSLSPIIIGGTALYVQARGSVVRDLGFDYQVDGYRGNDLTIFSTHLFEDYTLVDWAYQQIPNSVVWAVRDDGSLLGLTYVREHQVWAWHRHDSDGTFENVSVIPEGDQDFLYAVIKRNVDGRDVRYIERMATRFVSDVKDTKILDSFLSYDGRNSDELHTMTLSGSGWTSDDILTLTSSASYFDVSGADSDVGNQIQLTGPNGEIIRCTIIEDLGNSPTEVSVIPNKTVPASMQGVAISDWAKAVDTVRGLWHLEGKDVSIFGDGYVVANPNNPTYDVFTVTNGVLELDNPYAVIHVGLPYVSDIETLNVDTPSGETLADKDKWTGKVTLFVEKARGIWAGAADPGDDGLDDLTEIKIRNDEGYDDPIALQTGTVDVNIKATWNAHGRVFIRQTDPVPATILAVVPSGLYPFRG